MLQQKEVPISLSYYSNYHLQEKAFLLGKFINIGSTVLFFSLRRGKNQGKRKHILSISR